MFLIHMVIKVELNTNSIGHMEEQGIPTYRKDKLFLFRVMAILYMRAQPSPLLMYENSELRAFTQGVDSLVKSGRLLPGEIYLRNSGAVRLE